VFRIPPAALLAAGITCGLFLIMFKLISPGSGGDEALDIIAGIRFGSVEIPDEITTRSRRVPDKPPPPKRAPPLPKMQVSRVEQAVTELPKLDLPDLDLPLAGGTGMFIGNFGTVDRTAEGDIVPIVAIRPMYPHDAAVQGIEGWVKVEFTITEAGLVRDPRVVDARPPRIFNREALRAIIKWKFKPRIVDGVAVERKASLVIDFNLDQG
jgi:protein TonB